LRSRTEWPSGVSGAGEARPSLPPVCQSFTATRGGLLPRSLLTGRRVVGTSHQRIRRFPQNATVSLATVSLATVRLVVQSRRAPVGRGAETCRLLEPFAGRRAAGDAMRGTVFGSLVLPRPACLGDARRRAIDQTQERGVADSWAARHSQRLISRCAVLKAASAPPSTKRMTRAFFINSGRSYGMVTNQIGIR